MRRKCCRALKSGLRARQRIESVDGKVYEQVRTDGVHEAVYGRADLSVSYSIVNIAVNSIGTNSIVNVAVNSIDGNGFFIWRRSRPPSRPDHAY